MQANEPRQIIRFFEFDLGFTLPIIQEKLDQKIKKIA